MSEGNHGILVDREPVFHYNSNQRFYYPEMINTNLNWGLTLVNGNALVNGHPAMIFEPTHGGLAFAQALNLTLPHPPHLYSVSGNGDGQRNVQHPSQLAIRKNQPELIDVNQSTACQQNSEEKKSDNILISNDENEVIFVKEYKTNEKPKEVDEKPKPRRNPVRKVRTNKGKNYLKRDHILEEDFGLLDELEEANLVTRKDKTVKEKIVVEASTSTREPLKEWPINAFEGPEYNSLADKIEPFDYTIRDIQSTEVKEKPKSARCIKPKKSKKKHVISKRKPKAPKPVEKVSVNELSEVVAATFQKVGGFVKEHKENSKGATKEIFSSLLFNQASLMAIVNGNYNSATAAESIRNILS